MLAQTFGLWNFKKTQISAPLKKSAEEQRGCAAAAALWLSAYMAFRNAANDTFACARARAPRLCEGLKLPSSEALK